MADEPPRRRVGRPPLDPEDRSVTLNVRVPPKDYDAVYSEASRQRQTMAQWVRATIQRQLRIDQRRAGTNQVTRQDE